LKQSPQGFTSFDCGNKFLSEYFSFPGAIGEGEYVGRIYEETKGRPSIPSRASPELPKREGIDDSGTILET